MRFKIYIVEQKKSLSVRKKKRSQYSYSSTCNHTLNQMHTKDLGVYPMFPCTFKNRASIKNEFLSLMMHDVTKRMGMAAHAETLERNYYERWKENECKWATWLLKT